MTYPTEEMISMMENLREQANDMEKHVKNMIEAQGRASGILFKEIRKLNFIILNFMKVILNLIKEKTQETSWMNFMNTK